MEESKQGEVGDMEFHSSCVETIKCGEIPGVNKKTSGISMTDQEKIIHNFCGFWFLAQEFPRG